METHGDRKVKLNIGCGIRKKDGWQNIDIDASVKPDLVWDIRNGLPYKNDTVTEIFASHVLEHLTQDELVLLMREIWRVCQKGTKITIIAPYWNHVSAFDLDHKCVITSRTFKVWQRDYSSVQSSEKYTLGFAFFKIVEMVEDTDGARHSEPQLYGTLEVDK